MKPKARPHYTWYGCGPGFHSYRVRSYSVWLTDDHVGYGRTLSAAYVAWNEAMEKDISACWRGEHG
jgi:hypothetical protein